MSPKTKKPKGKITIVEQMCKGCGYCIEHCPKGSISFADHYNAKGYYPAVFSSADECTGCGICAVVCPEGIIEVWREQKSSAGRS